MICLICTDCAVLKVAANDHLNLFRPSRLHSHRNILFNKTASARRPENSILRPGIRHDLDRPKSVFDRIRTEAERHKRRARINRIFDVQLHRRPGRRDSLGVGLRVLRREKLQRSHRQDMPFRGLLCQSRRRNSQGRKGKIYR